MKSNFRIFLLACIFSLSFIYPDLKAGNELPLLLDPDKTISLDLQDAGLKDVLKIFSIQSGLNFIASETVQDRKITLYLDKVPIKEAMDKLFKANNLSYEYDEAANIFTVQYWGAAEAEKITRIYKLKHCNLLNSNIEKEKTSLFATKGIGGGTTTGTTGTTAGAGETEGGTNIVNSIKQVLSKDGKVTEDNRTNSLIVTDIPSRFPAIEEIIKELDISQPQVMLEIEMLDVSKNVLDKLGFDVGSYAGTANPLTLKFFPKLSFHDRNYMAGRAANLGAEGYLTLTNRYALLLDLLIQETDTRYLARPRILTLNNETAEIGVTKDEIVNTKTETIYSSTGQPSTTSTYERATSLSLTPEGIGIFLRVTPRIDLETGEVTMVINPKTSSTTLSTVVTGTQTAQDPEVRVTKSIVKVKDGETIVIGGLIHREKTELKTKIPILGDIPLLGMLFRHKTTSKNIERELLVFITPRIIRDDNVKLLAQGSKKDASGGRGQSIDSVLNIFDRRKK